MLVFLLFATLCGALSPLDKLKDQVLQAQPADVSLLQRCLDGQPILMETRDLPADGRANGDPCADDYQCKSHHCVCQSHGGKECQATGNSNPGFPECEHVDALLAIDAYCWTPGDAKWRNLGNVPEYAVDVNGLQESTDGRPDGGDADRFGSFLFNNIVKVVKGLDISPAAQPALTLEIWVKRRANANSREWVLGHDNGGYDRAINLHDDRYGGVAGPTGGNPQASPLGYPQLDRWAHVVVTYGSTVKTYLNGQVWNEGPANNGPGLPDFSIGGLTAFAGHYVNAFISQVRVYGRELSSADVSTRYTTTLPRYEGNFIRISRNELDRAAYRIGGYAGGGSYLVLNGAGAVTAPGAPVASPPSNAISFYVYSVTPTTENYLRFGQEYYLRTADGRYLERKNRISAETNTQAPHLSARFDVQLVASPTQTWKVDNADAGTTGFVPNDAPIGMNIGGTGSDWSKPDNNIRRLITLRPNDISVVVWWYQSDERIHMVRV
jgi:hypothetical protein